jgi:hypothetical protein
VSVCKYTHTHLRDGWDCDVPTHNYALSMQTSFRITIIEMYAKLDKVKHNTSHLVLTASKWLKYLLSPHYQIWRESVQCKPLWYMSTDGQTAMMKVVDFFAVCGHELKDAVHKQSYDIWIHANWLHLFSPLRSSSGLWHTLAELTNAKKAHCPVYVTSRCTRRCPGWQMGKRNSGCMGGNKRR